MASLTVYMNGYRVGTFTKATNGAVNSDNKCNAHGA